MSSLLPVVTVVRTPHSSATTEGTARFQPAACGAFERRRHDRTRVGDTKNVGTIETDSREDDRMATTVGLLHPGEMGSVVGQCLRRGGARGVWASAGRSEASRRRAAAGGLEDHDALWAVVSASDVIFSVCPPGSAVDVARLVAAERFRGLYLDANAVAPETVRRVGEIVGARGAELVDGGIIGPPPREAGATRLYLAGPRA